MLDLTFGQASDDGKVRSNNEDSMGFFAPRSRQEARSRGWMFVVADGVGGLDFGEIASTKAVETMIDGFSESPEGASLPSLLPRLAQHANAAVHDEGLRPQRRGKLMATTLVCCAIRHDQATIVHVGDSRCYQVREGSATLLTRDHTWVEDQRKLGLLSGPDAERSENRHILTRSLGPELFVTLESRTLKVQPGDRLVLCTDGVHGCLCDEDLARIASQNKDMDAIAQDIVSYATEIDGSDNATAQVVHVHSVEAMGMYRGRLYPLPVA